jgi:NAD(P)-dependent dehydrogenase (short-subunit alcohol dehydrogenase family)
MVCDVRYEDQAARLVEAAERDLGAIDVLCNNAGIAWEESFLEITPADWDQIPAVNLRGMFLVAQAVARRMMARGQGGAIINMASKNGLFGEVKYAHYNASKGGVVLLTKTMALELGAHNIRVNTLCPGYKDERCRQHAFVVRRSSFVGLQDELLKQLLRSRVVPHKISIVGAGSAALAGTLLGLIAGYYGRWGDLLIMRLIDVPRPARWPSRRTTRMGRSRPPPRYTSRWRRRTG